MIGGVAVRAILTLLTLMVGYFAFLLLSMTLSGSDLKTIADQLAYFGGIAIILGIVIFALVLIWRQHFI